MFGGWFACAIPDWESFVITRHLAAAAIGALSLTAAHVAARATEVKVLSAVGMRQVMFDLGPEFERATRLAVAWRSPLTVLAGSRSESPRVKWSMSS